MRLLLDAHISGRIAGRHLRERGHDVRALDEHRELDGIDDHEVLALSTAEGRVLVTHNVQDFPEILRRWADDGRDHAGCIMIVGIHLDNFGLLIRAIEVALTQAPDQDAWLSRPAFASRF